MPSVQRRRQNLASRGPKEFYGGTLQMSSLRRRRRGVRDAEGVEGFGNGERVFPSPADYEVWGRRKLHLRGPGQSPCEK